ncbi:MAG: HAD family hydrolase [Myxococcota bacterium]
MGAALFDLDRTLLDCNSGRLWVAHEWRQGRIGWRDAAWASWWLARYTLGMAEGMEDVFEIAVASFEGVEEELVKQRTQAWFDDECASRLRPGAAEALEKHRAAGDRLVLATSSTLYSALAAQKLWGFDDLVCTRLEVRDGRFTGRISGLAYGEAKLERVREWAREHAVDLGDCTFYTDSITDLSVMEAVGAPVAVNPDVKLSRLASARSWPTVDWGRG